MAQQPPAGPVGPQPSTTVPAAPPGWQPPTAVTGTTNTLAVVSIVAGVASFVFAPVIGAIVAVITGHMAKSQIRQTGEGGDGLATIGLILGYVHLALVVLGILIVVLILGGLGVFFATHSH